MSTSISTRLLEALFSHFCHDLISPVTAIANGMELLEELGADEGGEAIELVARSAALASARLQVYRMAYGMAGRDSTLRSRDINRLLQQLLKAEDDKCTLQWDVDPFADLDQNGPEGWGKIVLCCAILAKDALPRGGNVTVSLKAANQIMIEGRGQGAKLPKIEGEFDSQSAHMGLTQYFIDDLGVSLEMTLNEDHLALCLTLPIA